jgi:2-polyprenyl-3-methyl-5-hydroxy-6-metoxy-1,4-benzoquinol methylase
VVTRKVLDPVLAYDRVAPSFPSIAAPRRAYLDQIDRLIVSAIPPGNRSLLDVGAGDGARSLRVAREAGLLEVTLLEPSGAMRRLWPAGVHALAIRAEELASLARGFDVILCLWNVIGHIFPAPARTEVLRQFGRLASPGGRVFMDVNHRYNVRHYGLWPTIGRRLYDWVHPCEQNGDVTVTWTVAGAEWATRGHVFTHQELGRMIAAAGLQIEYQYTVDYSTGALCRRTSQGNPLYVLRPGGADVGR